MQAHKEPSNLVEVFISAMPGGIERQEARGQEELCTTDVLPKDCPRSVLESYGIKFGTDHDELFVNVTLPAGWKKQATDHSMHSDLLDNKGRKRAGIFYKAAFYDRKAGLHLVGRYSVDCYESCDKDGTPKKFGEHTHFQTVARDGKTVLESFGLRFEAYSKENRALQDAQSAAACAWLNERFPNWEDRAAYWD